MHNLPNIPIPGNEDWQAKKQGAWTEPFDGGRPKTMHCHVLLYTHALEEA